MSGLELAQEAQRAVAHFGVTDLHNSQFVIAQPQKYNEAGFNSGAGYCAWHDYTQPQYYPGVQPGISFTNMPYVLNSGASCGQNSVNTGYYTGRLDGFTIVIGHEIEETITDPGAEDVINGVNLGGWYDYAAYENGDKCAWVGYTEGIAPPVDRPRRPEQHHGQRRQAVSRAEPLEQRLRRRRRLLRRRRRRPARHRLGADGGGGRLPSSAPAASLPDRSPDGACSGSTLLRNPFPTFLDLM